MEETILNIVSVLLFLGIFNFIMTLIIMFRFFSHEDRVEIKFDHQEMNYRSLNQSIDIIWKNQRRQQKGQREFNNKIATLYSTDEDKEECSQ